MRKVNSVILLVLIFLVMTGCRNVYSSKKVELSDMFSREETFFWGISEEESWYTLTKTEDGKIEIVDLMENIVYSCDYKVERVKKNIYKYYFKGGQNIDPYSNTFGGTDTWSEYNVINIDNVYVFDRVSESKDNSNSSYEEVNEYYKDGRGFIVFAEK